MSSSKKCLKCGHVATFETTPGPTCPACGAVYSKVEAAVAAGTTPLRPPATTAVSQATRASPTWPEAGAAFIERLRAESHYPSFRAVVRVIYWGLVVLAVSALIGGAFAAYVTRTASPMFGGLVAAILVMIVAKVGTEMSLMLADLSDAAVRIVQRD